MMQHDFMAWGYIGGWDLNSSDLDVGHLQPVLAVDGGRPYPSHLTGRLAGIETLLYGLGFMVPLNPNP